MIGGMQIIATLITRCGCRRRMKMADWVPRIAIAMLPDLKAELAGPDTKMIPFQPAPEMFARYFDFHSHRTSKSGKFLFVTYVERHD